MDRSCELLPSTIIKTTGHIHGIHETIDVEGRRGTKGKCHGEAHGWSSPFELEERFDGGLPRFVDPGSLERREGSRWLSVHPLTPSPGCKTVPVFSTAGVYRMPNRLRALTAAILEAV